MEKSRAGSLRYMAPELVRNECLGSFPALDIWSLGCILFAITTGELPFSGKDSVVETKIKEGEYQFPSNSNLSYNLRKLIKGILVTDPKRRFTLNQIEEHPWIDNNLLKKAKTNPIKKVIKKTNTSDFSKIIECQIKIKEQNLPKLNLNLISDRNDSPEKKYFSALPNNQNTNIPPNVEEKFPKYSETPITKCEQSKNIHSPSFPLKESYYQTIGDNKNFLKGFFEASNDIQNSSKKNPKNIDTLNNMNFGCISAEYKIPSYLRPIHHNKEELNDINLLSKFSNSPKKISPPIPFTKKPERSSSIIEKNPSSTNLKKLNKC